jgi:hypothetical protein
MDMRVIVRPMFTQTADERASGRPVVALSGSGGLRLLLVTGLFGAFGPRRFEANSGERNGAGRSGHRHS